MKTVSRNIRFCLASFYIQVATFNFFVALDIIFSTIAHLDRSSIHDLPVDISIIALLCLNFLICSICAFLAGPYVINREAGKKTVICFSLMAITLITACIAAYDVNFSIRLNMSRSALFNLPAEKWFFALIAFPGIVLLFPFSKLSDQLLYIKNENKENVEPADENTEADN